MPKKVSDYVFHPPSGSSLPGSPDANPYFFYPPEDLRRLLETEKDETELAKMRGALDQWERIYVYPGYPYRRVAAKLRSLVAKLIRLSEVNGPHPRNMPYYNDAEVSEGYEGILDSLRGPYDNYDMIRFDYERQGERPIRDIDIGKGDFLSPREPPMDAVKPRGDGPDPDGMEVMFPPTGGNIGGWTS